jgi:hypothetical protein
LLDVAPVNGPLWRLPLAILLLLQVGGPGVARASEAEAAAAICTSATNGVPRDPRFGVAEAWRNLDAAARTGATWERLVFSWQHVQPHPEIWNAPYYFSDRVLCDVTRAGFQVVGLIQDTPEWARVYPNYGATSPPFGLYEAWDSPDNVWARFIERMAYEYRGRIDHWIIWNEPEFQPGDQGGIYLTWSGNARDYYQLMKVAYQAAKYANPDATLVLGATSYWIDVVNGRRQFLERLLEIAARDPEAAEHGYFFDAVALNVYWAPDDVWGLARVLRQMLAVHGLEKPLWITETNAMPYDDPITPKEPNGQRVTLQEQAAFVIQAYAMGAAADYQRIGWHAMIDRDTSDEIWGLTRNDGSLRPAFAAYQVASRYLSNAERVTFKPLEHTGRPRAAPDAPNWQVYQVVFERGPRRVSVLWNGAGESARVRLPRLGASALLVDQAGRETNLRPAGEWWEVDLPPATARGPLDPPGYYYVGGDPRLLVEAAVPEGSPVVAPVVVR